MINNVTLVGRLTKDPELRFTPDGTAVCNFTLAVNRNFKNAQGETEADFIMIQVWRKPAENAANFLKKGSLAGVTGSIRTRNYDGTDGKKVYVTEVLAESVQFLEPKKDGQAQSGGSAQQAAQNIANHNNNNQQQYQNNNQGNYQQQPQAPRNQGNYQPNQGQHYQYNNQQNYGNNNQQNYQQPGQDPFANSQQINISDDDLPF